MNMIANWDLSRRRRNRFPRGGSCHKNPVGIFMTEEECGRNGWIWYRYQTWKWATHSQVLAFSIEKGCFPNSSSAPFGGHLPPGGRYAPAALKRTINENLHFPYRYDIVLKRRWQHGKIIRSHYHIKRRWPYQG